MSLAAELRQLTLFQSLSEEDLALVGQQVTVRRVGIHQPVFHIGDVGDSMYFVRFGEVKVVLPTEGGGEMILARLGRNQYFGEMALLTGEPRSASVITALDSEFFVLTKEGFDALFRHHPALALNLSHTLSQRLRETTAGRRDRERLRTLCCLSAAGALDGRYLSVHLAAAIARESRRRVALLDLNPGAGSAQPALAC
jgi:CRP-like cAMP-binding protein